MEMRMSFKNVVFAISGMNEVNDLSINDHIINFTFKGHDIRCRYFNGIEGSALMVEERIHGILQSGNEITDEIFTRVHETIFT